MAPGWVKEEEVGESDEGKDKDAAIKAGGRERGGGGPDVGAGQRNRERERKTKK